LLHKFRVPITLVIETYSTIHQIAGDYPLLPVSILISISKFHYLTIITSYETIAAWGKGELRVTSEQKKRLLKAKIAVALHNELGRVPKQEEIEQVNLLARVLYKAILGLHYKRKKQKKNGQLAIF
jgi:hypothetical protein